MGCDRHRLCHGLDKAITGSLVYFDAYKQRPIPTNLIGETTHPRHSAWRLAIKRVLQLCGLPARVDAEREMEATACPKEHRAVRSTVTDVPFFASREHFITAQKTKLQLQIAGP